MKFQKIKKKFLSHFFLFWKSSENSRNFCINLVLILKFQNSRKKFKKKFSHWITVVPLITSLITPPAISKNSPWTSSGTSSKVASSPSPSPVFFTWSTREKWAEPIVSLFLCVSRPTRLPTGPLPLPISVRFVSGFRNSKNLFNVISDSSYQFDHLLIFWTSLNFKQNIKILKKICFFPAFKIARKRWNCRENVVLTLLQYLMIFGKSIRDLCEFSNFLNFFKTKKIFYLFIWIQASKKFFFSLKNNFLNWYWF